MNPQELFTIAAVERDTRLSKDTLRIWERRYGFPQPLRNQQGERLYPADQVQRLQLMQILLSGGLRPAAIAGLPLEALQGLLDQRQTVAPPPPAAALALHADCLRALRQHDMPALLQLLNRSAKRLGLAGLVCDVLADLTAEVGRAWARGQIEVFEEHLYTECVSTMLRQALAELMLQSARQRPRILLTTVPQEAHGLGLLMAHTLMALQGCDCRSLGLQTPLQQLVQAVSAQAIDVLALSFSQTMRATDVQRNLRDVRLALPEQVQIWAGGSHPALVKLALPGVTTLARLEDIGPAIAAWREAASLTL
ncbi:MerR family transcriptional regulator [Rugamonas fusca]|nr:MerR family transcriptional regulator [Rugamonas fusca]